jgi:hypothetical protein
MLIFVVPFTAPAHVESSSLFCVVSDEGRGRAHQTPYRRRVVENGRSLNVPTLSSRPAASNHNKTAIPNGKRQ